MLMPKAKHREVSIPNRDFMNLKQAVAAAREAVSQEVSIPNRDFMNLKRNCATCVNDCTLFQSLIGIL